MAPIVNAATYIFGRSPDRAAKCARFNATAFYPGGLLLLGELVK